MRSIVYCEKCAFFGAGEADPEKRYDCPKCGSKLTMSDITENEWDNKTPEEKAAIKTSWGFPESIIVEKKQLLQQEKLMEEVSAIRNDLHFIKVLYEIGLILGLIGLFFWILQIMT